MPDNELVERAQTRVGTTLKGKYHIDRVLGVGGMAAVYGATHRNKKKFAIKILHPELSIQGDAKQRFLREGYVANTVDHPGAVAVLDDDVADDGAAFIVMELLDGGCVDEIANKHHGRLPARAVLAIADQLLAVLEAAHSKEIVHRDLKPANLFILRDGTLKVLDFGIARLRDAVASGPSGATQTGALMGTPAFLPPEQAGGRTREIDGQTDVWAAGATMFTLMSGEYIHTGENATQMVIFAATKPARSLGAAAPLPPAIVALVDRAVAFEKSARWENAAAMRAALRDVFKTQFGGAPTKEDLVALFEEHVAPAVNVRTQPLVTPTHDREIQHDETMQAAETGPRVSLGLGGTTAQPVSSTPMSDVAGVPKPNRLPVPALVGGAAVLALLMGLGARALLKQGHESAIATTLAPQQPVATTATAITTTQPTATPAVSNAQPAETQALQQPQSVQPTRATPGVHANKPQPSASPSAVAVTAASTATKPQCTYENYVDSNGITQVKKVCK